MPILPPTTYVHQKAHLLRGDILESLGDETAAIMSYRDVIRVSEERVKQAALSMNGESVLRQYGPILSKVRVITIIASPHQRYANDY